MSADLTANLPLGDALNRILGAIESLGARVSALEAKVDERFASLEARIARLETKGDERLKETRPMSARIDQILAEIVDVKESVRDMDRSLRQLQLDGLRRQRDFDERLASVEERLS